MSRDFPESDWKVFRQLSAVALERFCERVLSDVSKMAADPGKTYHERYLAIFDLTRNRDRDIARVFNDPRRSVAFIQLMGIRSLGLLSEDELARFSPETREAVRVLGGG
jgi:hypothetical protein